jgi:hypothetical protein
MLAKGPAILACDDFAPVNDPWPLDRFVQAATNAGLRWLGESDPGENLPPELSEDFLVELRNQVRDPLAFQMAVDEALERRFRSGILCRDDAPVAGQVSLERVMEFAYRTGNANAGADEITRAVRSFAPACVVWNDLAGRLPAYDPNSLAREIYDGITRGRIRPRIETVSYISEPPEFPRLDAFRLICARECLPLVDVWHQPCAFPAAHYQVLAAMDGSRSLAALAAFSKERCPELAFDQWMRHLAGRGMFG